MVLDPQVARITGSTDSMVRSYVDKDTAVVVHLLVLYGRAESVSAHTPEVCYPAIGYELVDESVNSTVAFGKNRTASFRSLVYARKGSDLDREEVYYAFRQLGKWSADVESNWRALNADPSLFKVQVQRRVGDRERRNVETKELGKMANPTEQFLAELLPELEKRIDLSLKSGGAVETPRR